MRSYAESVRVFRDVTLLVSLTILFIILMGLIGYVNDEIRLRSKEIAIRKVNGAETESICCYCQEMCFGWPFRLSP